MVHTTSQHTATSRRRLPHGLSFFGAQHDTRAQDTLPRHGPSCDRAAANLVDERLPIAPVRAIYVGNGTRSYELRARQQAGEVSQPLGAPRQALRARKSIHGRPATEHVAPLIKQALCRTLVVVPWAPRPRLRGLGALQVVHRGDTRTRAGGTRASGAIRGRGIILCGRRGEVGRGVAIRERRARDARWRKDVRWAGR